VERWPAEDVHSAFGRARGEVERRTSARGPTWQPSMAMPTWTCRMRSRSYRAARCSR
jgi:hypothetical protein